jgi:two-component system OmpR family sensor kinase
VSLRGRLVLAVAGVALAALVASGLATYSALHAFLYSRVDQSLQQTAASLPHPGSSGLPAGGPPPRATAAGAMAEKEPPPAVRTDAPGVSVEVRNQKGTVIEAFPGYQQGGQSYLPELPATIDGFSRTSASVPPEAYFTTASTTAGGPRMRVLAVEEPNGDTLVLGVPLAGTETTLDHLVLIELVVAAAALAAAALLGLWLVRLGLRPLADVEDTAERIAAGVLDERVPGENDRTEVGRLARTVNVMLSRIQQAFAQRDATEAALRASEERLRRFVADASHELRTPLAAVSAYAELFDRGASEHPDDLRRVMTGIQGEASRMGRLVEDLFLLARLDEGRPLERQPVDLTALAAEAVQTATAVGPAWPVSLAAERPVEVIGDEARLRQVVDNLLANVRAHTPAGTPVVVSVSAVPTPTGPDEAVIEVADRGPGVGEGAARIFERFYRADPSRSRGGTGLGLAIVAAIVAAHTGRVAATDRPGGGTVVTVRLPLVPTEAPRPAGH